MYRHDGYDCTCENRRLMEISKDASHRPVVMVRFNPDGYVCAKEGKVPSTWACNTYGVCTVKKKWKDARDARLTSSSQAVGYLMKKKSHKLIEVVEVYF